MDKATLRERTRQLLGSRTSTLLTDSWYDERVLNGYKRLLSYQSRSVTRPGARTLRFPEHDDRFSRTLDTTLFATNNFASLQSGALFVTDIWDRTNKRGLTMISEAKGRKRHPDDAGSPREWWPAGHGGVVGYYVWPRPGASDAISVYEFVVTAPVLTSDTDSPLIDSAWHPAITYAAASEGALLVDDAARHVELERKFEAYVAERLTTHEHTSLRGGRAGATGYFSVGEW